MRRGSRMDHQRLGVAHIGQVGKELHTLDEPVSYTHLTLPTSDLV